MSNNQRRTASSTNKTPDLRVRRTRQFLQDALIALMKEKSFQEVQITELTARAQVSRPAFYLHFGSKEELLLSLVDVTFDEFYAEVSREIDRGNVDWKKFCIMLFQYWERYAEMLRMVVQAGNPDILLERIQEYARLVMKAEAAQVRQPKRDPRMEELIVGFIAGGSYMLLSQWVTQRAPLSAEQMGELFYKLIGPTENI